MLKYVRIQGREIQKKQYELLSWSDRDKLEFVEMTCSVLTDVNGGGNNEIY